jgi:hypothetical protein
VDIKVLCPSCSKQLKAPASLAGKQAQCPHCKARMLLPEIVHQAEEMALPPPPRPTSTPRSSTPPQSASPSRPASTTRPVSTPRPVSAPQQAPLPPPSPLANISSLLDEEEEYRLMAGPKVNTPASEPPRRPCPMCGEMIAVGAAKCRYCNAIFDEGLRRVEKKKKKKRSYSDDESDLSAGDWVVAFLCSGIGLIAGIVWALQGKPKGLKMIGASIVLDIVKTVIYLIVSAAQNSS